MSAVAVTGGRHFCNRELVYRTLDAVHAENPITLLVHGNCVDTRGRPCGADRLAWQWADDRGIHHTGQKYQADWKLYGLGAGPVRNRWMLVNEKPTLLVAFPGGSGTNGCCRIAEKLGIEVRRIEE